MQRWEGLLVVFGEFHHSGEDEEGGNGQTHLRILNRAGGAAAPLRFWERARVCPPALSHARL